MKKLLIWLFVIAMVVTMIISFSLAGCKEEAVVEEAVEEEAVVEEAVEEISGEVSFATYWGSGAEAEAVDAVAEMFMEKYPNVTINIIPNDSETMVATTTMNMSSSKPWDTFMYWIGAQTATLAAADFIAPLDDVFENTKYDEIAPSVSAHSRYEDKLGNNSPWCLPINYGKYVVFYNTHVWENAGLTENDIPETWKDFIKVLDKIKESGVPPIVRSAGIAGYPSGIWFEQFLLKTSGTEYRAAIEASCNLPIEEGDASWDDAKFRKADDYWDIMEKYWHPDYKTLKYDEAYQIFARGEAGLQMIGDWILGSYQTDMGLIPLEDYSSFAFPIIDPGIEKTEPTWGGNALCLSKSGAENEAAVKWIEFWATPEVQQFYANKVPVTMAISGLQYDSPMLGRNAEVTKGAPTVLQFQTETEIFYPTLEVWDNRSLGVITQDEEIEQLEQLRLSIIK